jgi:hypothetical protein
MGPAVASRAVTKRKRAGNISPNVAVARMRHRNIGLAIDRGFMTVRTLGKSGAAAFAAWEAHKTIVEIANGKVDWNSVLALVVSGSLANKIMAIVTLLSLGFGAIQVKLRRDSTRQQGATIKKLEQIVDSKRSSSRLLPDGKTRKEDENEG